MNRRRFDDAVVGVLHRWVRAAEERQYLREPLRNLVAAIPASARDLRTLHYYLREWATDDDDPMPATTELLLHVLPRPEAVCHEAA